MSMIIEQNVLSTNHAHESAIEKADLDALRSILHQNFTWIHDKANKIQTSADEVVDFFSALWKKSGQRGNASRTLVHDQVLIEGDTAVVYGLITVNRDSSAAAKSGKKRESKFSYIKTFVLADGRIQLLACQRMSVPL
jgi:ketosteroid isomerase-like protein